MVNDMKVIISGYGKMGHMVEEELKEKGIELVEASEDIAATKPEVARECVCIDFTTPDAFKANYRFIAQHFKAAVVGTTGWYDIKDEVLAEFEKQGCTLIWSANFSIGVIALFAAVEKVSAAPAGTFDVILMDVNMPVMNGYEATAAIRALPDEAKASLPIIALTASTSEEGADEVRAAGMSGFASKPIDPDAIRRELARIRAEE